LADFSAEVRTDGPYVAPGREQQFYYSSAVLAGARCASAPLGARDGVEWDGSPGELDGPEAPAERMEEPDTGLGRAAAAHPLSARRLPPSLVAMTRSLG
jgi:hypothetical protein